MKIFFHLHSPETGKDMELGNNIKTEPQMLSVTAKINLLPVHLMQGSQREAFENDLPRQQEATFPLNPTTLVKARFDLKPLDLGTTKSSNTRHDTKKIIKTR